MEEQFEAVQGQLGRITQEVAELRKALQAARDAPITIDPSYTRPTRADTLQVNFKEEVPPWVLEKALEDQWGHVVPKGSWKIMHENRSTIKKAAIRFK
eukprot:8406949-Karenia_brevis.AAC.1